MQGHPHLCVAWNPGAHKLQCFQLSPTSAHFLWGSNLFCLGCRTALLALLVALLGGYFVIENPASSFICWHPDLLWVIRALRGAGMKETHLHSNNLGVQDVILKDCRTSPNVLPFLKQMQSFKFVLAQGCKVLNIRNHFHGGHFF